ncbi:VirB3 family type IV secretion system protein [Herpetosiphon gulosus]|uniref:Uncharacterized protein n=1 Tax=Herpetosiphon gulosus TaxID=1973496 RepID=A0ABP9WZA6_9CHLR
MNSRHPLQVAATKPLPLIVLAVGVVMALTIYPWLIVVAIIAYGLMVWMLANDPNILVQKQEAPKLAKITSLTFQSHLEAIDRTRREIVRSTNVTAGPLQRLLQPIADQANELFQQAHGLADKGQLIEQYLQTSQPHGLQPQIDSLDQRIAMTKDSYTVDQLKETRAALIDRQQNAQALATYYDRITAQLQNIAANLDNVLAETVRLRASEAASATQTSQEVAERLSNLNADMDAFQHVLEGAMSQSGVA